MYVDVAQKCSAYKKKKGLHVSVIKKKSYVITESLCFRPIDFLEDASVGIYNIVFVV